MSDKTKFESVKEYCLVNSVTAISPVRINTNHYPFVTMLSDKFEGGALNVYFSQAQAKKVAEGQPAKDLGLDGLSIAHTTNSDGELRIKITSKGVSTYSDIAELF
jgi:hypothetical protein